MMDDLRYMLANPVAVCGGIFMISLLALFTAFVAEFAFDLDPCVLCVYQRWPYAVTTLLGIAGLATLYEEEWIQYVAIIVFLAAIAFFVNGLIAFYHVGVEQHWWKSALEGCAVEFETGSMEELRAMFDKTIGARCDEVAWSFLGISMAGFNMVLSFLLAAGSGYSAVLLMRREQGAL